MNKIVKAAKKNIKKIVQNKMVTYKNWYEWLPHTLQAYSICN